MKRYLFTGLFFCSIILFIFSVYRTSDTAKYSNLLIESTEYEALKNTRSHTSRDLLMKISFNDVPSFYDEVTGSWFTSVSSHEPKLNPSVGFTGTEKNTRIAFSEQITPGKSTEFIAYNESEYKTYTLAATTLPLARINCDAEFLSIQNNIPETDPSVDLTEKTYPMQFMLIDNLPDAIQTLVSSEGLIHLHGAGTLHHPKKSFRITLLEKTAGKDQLEYKTALLGMRQDGDWLLYPAYNDQEKIRNVFSANLWYNSCAADNSFNLMNGNEYRFIELFLNNRYWGLYALGYPIDTNQMRIFPDNQGHYEEFLFKQKAFGPKTENLDPGYDGLIIQHETSESDLNNGILILKMYFAQLKNGAAGRFWHNDEPNVIDIWLFTKLGQGYDTVRIPGMSKNLMVAIKKNNDGRKILFAPWDMDIYWGNINDETAKNMTIPYAMSPDDNSLEMTVNPVSILRETDPDVNEMIKERYAELRSDVWSDQKINEMLDAFEQDIYDSGAYLRDMERWPDGSIQDPDLKLSKFREYVHRRFNAMDKFVAEL